MATGAVAVVTLLIPYLPLGAAFGFRPLPMSFFMMLAGIVAAYVLTAELAKRAFYAHVNRGSESIYLQRSRNERGGT